MIEDEEERTSPRPTIPPPDPDDTHQTSIEHQQSSAPPSEEDTPTTNEGTSPPPPLEEESAAQAQSAVPPTPSAEDDPTNATQDAAPIETPNEVDPAATIRVPVPTALEPEQATPSGPDTSAPAPETVPAPPGLPFMSVEDLLALNIASDPQISPDGSLIAFTLQQNHPQENRTSSAIWLVKSGGGKAQSPRRLTSGTSHDHTPRWSPDGQTLAFLSDRSGSTQIHLLPMSGGEASQFSTLSQDISEYSWRPDGQMLLAQSPWKPADDQSMPDNDAVSVYQRLDGWHDGQEDKQGRYQQLWLLPLNGPALRLTSEPVDLVQSSWSPDGSEIAFCANRRADPDLSSSMALWVLTIATGQMRRLTPEEGVAQMPAWSPDGQRIAYLYTIDQTEAGPISPWIVSARGGALPEPATPGAEHLTCQGWIIDELRREWLARPIWYPDGKALLVPVQKRGQIHLYRLDTELRTQMWLTSGNGRYLSPQLSRDGRFICMVRADWFTPGDIWIMDSDGKNLRKLTKINDNVLQSHRLIRPKRVTWQSFDGLPIEGWLYLPPTAPQVKCPLILAPHGGPSLAWGDAYVHEFQVLAGRGYAVLAPNPRGSIGYGEAFSRKVLNDWGGDDLRDLLAGVDHVIATEAIDEQRLGVTGISYGGYMTNWIISQTGRFKAAVSRNGLSDLVSAAYRSSQALWFQLSMSDANRRKERSPLSFVEQIATPLLLLHAEDDLTCPFEQAMQLFIALRQRKQPVELVHYHHTSHLMDWPGVGTSQQRVDRLSRTLAWFKRYL